MSLFISAQTYIPYVLLSIFIWFICKKIPFGRFSAPIFTTIHFFISLILSVVWLCLIYGPWFLAEGKQIFSTLAQGSYSATAIIGWQYIFGILIYFIIAGIYYTIIYYRQYKEKALKETEMKLLTRDAELRALKMQINPHFLFNSLNSINALVTKNPKLARKMIEVLSDLFRISLDLKDKILLPLKNELEFAHKYLEIEKIRFSDRLTIQEDIDYSLLDKKFPALILQPLLENCIKHGITEKRGKCSILMKIVLENSNQIQCYISNTVKNSVTSHKIKQGTGLKNIQHRLRLLYDDNYMFFIDNADSDKFIVKMIIPIYKDEKN
ncbi:MAG: histidine kinase [bacterium]